MFRKFGVLIHCDVGGETIVYVSGASEISMSLKFPSDSAVWVPMLVRIEVQILRMQFMRVIKR